MASTIEIKPEEALIEWRISGHVSLDALNAGFDTIVADPDYSPALDFLVVMNADARLGDIDLEALQRFQSHIRQRRAEFDPSVRNRTALVFLRPEQMAMGVVHAVSYTKSEHSKTDMRAFPNEAEALAWLRS